MNEPKPKLFARYDPFIKSFALSKQSYEDGSGGILTVRPVWIIGDLIDLKEWFGSNLRKSNWQLNLRRTSILEHYKQMLLSSDGQSFMVEQNGVNAMQVDLLTSVHADFPGQFEFKSMDFIIHYLYKECFRDPGIFKRCLQCIIGFIYSYPQTDQVYMKLHKSELSKQEILLQMGFKLVVLHNFFGKSLNIYRIDRSGI